MHKLLASLVFALAICSTTAHADWTLDNSLSRLSFVSIKATDIAEVHHFGQLRGTLSEDGSANVTIELASVNTLIPIRDERMRTILFETNAFPTAQVNAKLDPKVLTSMAPGEVREIASEANIVFKSKEVAVTVKLLVAKTDANSLVVTSLAPTVVTAGQMGLSDQVEQLREIAGLPNISQAVPVTFVLTFSQKPL